MHTTPDPHARMRRNIKINRKSRLIEALESRILFTTDYVLDGNTLTTYTNGTPAAPVVVPDVNNVQLTGDTGVNHFIVQNFAGHVTIAGNGGGDQIAINAGGGGSYNIADGTAADQLTVRAPATIVANVSVGASTINVGSEAVTYPAGLGSIAVVGQIFATGDTLTVVGTSSNETFTLTGSTIAVTSRPLLYYSTFTQLTLTGNAGNDQFIVNGTTYPTSISANGAGDATFTVNTNSVALALSGSTSGTTAFTINGNAGPLTVTGQGAANTFNLVSNAAGATFTGGTSNNTYNISANSASVTINGGPTNNTVNVAANAGSIVVNGGAGADAFNVVTNSGSIQLKGGAGATTTYDLAGPTIGPVTVTGNAVGTGALTFRGTALHDVFAVTSTTLSAGTGATIAYSNLTSVTVDSVGGDDSFLVTSSGTPTTLLGRSGNHTVNLRANGAQTTFNGGTGTSTVNVGSNMPGLTGNVLATVAGGVNVIGSGTDVVNLNDQGNSGAATATLSTTGFTGIGGGLTYSGLATLNVKLGSGGNTLNVTGVAGGGTVTNVNLGTGANSVLVASGALDVDSVLGTLNLTGAGGDDLVIDDSGSAVAKTAVLATGSVTGMGAGTVNFTGFDTVDMRLGTAGNALTIPDVLASVSATVKGGSGADAIVVQDTHGALRVDTGGAGSVVNLRATHAAVTVNANGSAAVNVGTLAPAAGGVLAGIQAAVSVSGAGTDTLTLDDTGNAAMATGTVSGTKVTGFGMVAAGVTYANLGALSVNMGTGGGTVTVANTAAGTTTNVTGNSGDDAMLVQGTSGATTVTPGGGTNVVRVGSGTTTGQGVMDGIAAGVSVDGTGGTTQLVVDDGGNAIGKTVGVDGTTVSVSGAAAVTYSGIAALKVLTGSDADAVSVTGTGALTEISTGDGDDLVELRATGNDVTVGTGIGTNRIAIGSNGTSGGGVLAGIGGHVTVNGDGTTELDVDDWGNGVGTTTGEMTGTEVTGLTADGIGFTGVAKIVVSLGSGDDAFLVRDTIAGVTVLNTNAGADLVVVEKTSGDTTIANDAGADEVSVGGPGAGFGTLVMDGIAGALHLTANLGATYTLDLIDNGSTADKTATVSGGTATGLSPAAVDFAGVDTLDVLLGGGKNTVTLTSPAAAVGTNVTTGAGENVINVRSLDSAATLLLGPAKNVVNVGSNAPSASSVLDLINGALVVHGGGLDELNLYDASNTVAKGVTIDAGTVSGAAPVAVAFDSIGALRVTLGSGSDTVTVNDSSAFLTLDTAGGNDSVTVRKTTRDVTLLDAGGANTFTIGSAGQKMETIVGNVGVTSNADSILVLDDSGSTTGKTVNVTADHVTGLSAADVSYVVGMLEVRLGSGNDTVSVSGTSAVNGTLVSLGTGSDVMNVGSGAGVTPVVGPVTVAGSGNDTLNVSDAGASGARAGSLTTSRFAYAGAVVNYSGLSNVNVTLVGQTTFGVRSTLGSVTTVITAGGGTVTVGGTGASNLTAGVVGPVSINGSLTTDVVVDDSGDTIGRTVGVTGTAVSGLTSQPVTYAGAKSLTVMTTIGSDTVSVVSTHARPTRLWVVTGTDQVSVRATSGPLSVEGAIGGHGSVVLGSLAPTTAGGVMSGIGANVTVLMPGGALTIDDSGTTAVRSVTVDNAQVTGLNEGGVVYAGVTSVKVLLGSGNDGVNVQSTSVATSIDAGGGNDAVTVQGGGLVGALAVSGSAGSDSLVVNNGASGGSGTVTLTPSQITGMGGPIGYTGFSTLALVLGASESLAVNDIDPATATTVTVPSGKGGVLFAGAFAGQLNVSNLSQGFVSVAGALTGALAVAGSAGAVIVGGSLGGTVTVGGNAEAVTVGGDLAGTLGVGSKLTRMAIGGRQTGTITVGATDFIGISGAVPAAGTGALLVVSEGGVVRSVRTIAADGVTAAGVTARVAYDSMAGNTPQAAVELRNADSSKRFDLILEAPANSDGFNLTRVDGADRREVGVRNVNVVGDLFNKGVTGAQATFLNDPGTGAGGVNLPSDDLAAVAVTGNMALWSVRGRSVQAVGFSSVTYKKGTVWSAAAVEGMKDWQADILIGTLALNPASRLPAARLVTPTETLRAFAGLSAKKPVALFIPTEKFKKFVSFPTHLVDQRIDGLVPVAAEMTYQRKWESGLPVITNLTFRGQGGSVDTRHIVKKIVSTGLLGDVNLRAGKAEVLQSLEAPGMFGTLNLFGGRMAKAAIKGLSAARHFVGHVVNKSHVKR